MNNERLKVIPGAEAAHFGALRFAQFIGHPAAWTGGENLQRIASQTVRTLGSILHASRGRGVNAYAAGREARRAFRGGSFEDVLFLRHGAGHTKKYRGVFTAPM